jgi:predicted CoA-binding protein
MIAIDQVHEFLAHLRIAVIGVSEDPKKFGNVIYRALIQHGYDALPVNPSAPMIDGVRCYPDLASIPGDLARVIVAVRPEGSAQAVRDCIARGITDIWLFEGLGAPGANTDEAVELCRTNNINVIAGACPLMFLEPVSGFHRLHRGMRKLNKTLVPAT